MTDIAFLLVTCSVESTRATILDRVIDNLKEQAPELKNLTVFDNASTIPGTIQKLSESFTNVYQSSKNVGYWTAIDWWLNSFDETTIPRYAYVIESDLIHHSFYKVWSCVSYLDQRPTIGGVRLHEYDVANKHLYNKDVPLPNSKSHAWRSHIHLITKSRIDVVHDVDDFYTSNFTAHLPAVNRYEMLKKTFARLREMRKFSEHDFQRICHDYYQSFAILDGGIYTELAFNGSKSVGSFLPDNVLKELRYQSARTSSIIPLSEYTVTRM